MAQTFDTPTAALEAGEESRLREAPEDSPALEVERRLDAFLSELRRMSPEERIRASRFSFDYWERSVYAGRYPDEVPLLNGELEWIASNLA